MEETVVRYLQGLASKSDLRDLEQWRCASPANQEKFREIVRVWELTAAARARISDHRATANNVIREAAGRRARLRDTGRTVWILGGAAAALLATGLGIGYLAAGTVSGGAPLAAAEFSTGAWEMATVRLGDGTIVRLAPHSALTVSGEKRHREVRLEGEAFFAVAKRPGSPFTVRTRHGDALVLGTRFDVRVQKEDLRVVVVEGRVALSSGGGQVNIERGQMAVAPAGGRATVLAVDRPDELLDWLNYSLMFQATPLEQVADEIRRRYKVSVDLDSTLAKRTVTAWFTNQSLEEVVTITCRVVGATCSTRDGKVVISRGPHPIGSKARRRVRSLRSQST
jgi:transmembrane sensor